MIFPMSSTKLRTSRPARPQIPSVLPDGSSIDTPIGDSTQWQYWVIDTVKEYEREMGYDPHPDRHDLPLSGGRSEQGERATVEQPC